jgi:surfactin synthase thioesterase subunit
MGGGADSRIPSILSECLPAPLEVTVRTYDFDPEIAREQISSWIEELHPVVLAGESLGANHALAMYGRYGLPTVLVSPALNAPAVLSSLAPITLVPGVGALLDRIYRPRPGDRQAVHFRYALLRKWKALRLTFDRRSKVTDLAPFAFFGTHDHYRRSGIVSLRGWRKRFGEGTYTLYDGSHFMEEQYVRTLLADRIRGLAEGSCE